MSKTWENITKNKTFWYIIAGIGIILVVYIFFKLLKKYKPGITDSIKINSGNLSYESVQYKLWADQLFNAMDGAGTDEDAIIAVIVQLRTLDDWNMLVKAYGTRELKTFWISTHKGTLPSALRSELGATHIEKINSHLVTFGVSI
jgi:hypothetical protein